MAKWRPMIEANRPASLDIIVAGRTSNAASTLTLDARIVPATAPFDRAFSTTDPLALWAGTGNTTSTTGARAINAQKILDTTNLLFKKGRRSVSVDEDVVRKSTMFMLRIDVKGTLSDWAYIGYLLQVHVREFPQ